MKIAIVDDSVIDMKLIKTYILESRLDVNMKDIDTFENAEDFMKAFQPNFYDVAFLDIFMPKDSGITLAKFIRERDSRVAIVFNTSSNEFATESYAVRASYYLNKPYTKKHFNQMLDVVFPTTKNIRYLPDEQCFVPENIIFTEYFNHRVTIYSDNASPVTSWITQGEFCELIADLPYLYQCNRGTIVNFYHVDELTVEGFVMDNGEVLTISRSKEKESKKLYNEFLLKKWLLIWDKNKPYVGLLSNST